ncbi:MAG TPA: DUF4180 domain-containing protein [Gammaproteobacteria bacterium]|nr:DUF4180 domain-containing protein [Gammaproteobacteria bacterium]
MSSDPQRPSVASSRDIGDVLRRSLAPTGCVLAEEELGPEFFDLRTGLAGELFQKIVNYRGRLAIVIRDARVHGDRFAELAYEHRNHPAVRFFTEHTEARRWLGG